MYIRVVRWGEVQEFGEMCETEYWSTVYSLFGIITINSNLSNDRSKASSKTIPPHSAN